MRETVLRVDEEVWRARIRALADRVGVVEGALRAHLKVPLAREA